MAKTGTNNIVSRWIAPNIVGFTKRKRDYSQHYVINNRRLEWKCVNTFQHNWVKKENLKEKSLDPLRRRASIQGNQMIY